MDLKTELAKIFSGELDNTPAAREFYSHDASLFELKPEIVAFPKDAGDIKNLVKFVADNKQQYPELSVVARGRGTDMSGGAIGQSIILDTSQHMKAIKSLSATESVVEPGLMYKDFDVATKELGAILPSYPASRDLAGLGGMVANNSGGELSLSYGKTDRYVTKLNVILSDGNEYEIKPLSRSELNAKLEQDDFEGRIYRDTLDLLDKNYTEIAAAAPKVSKDSTGYHLWDIWNPTTGVFDLTKLFVGSQGTLGVITQITFDLVPEPKHKGTLVCYLPTLDHLGEIIPAVLEHQPATFECFDDNTLWLCFRFIFSFIKRLGFWSWLKMCLQLIPDGLALVRGIPKLILLIEFTGENPDEVKRKIRTARLDLQRFNFTYMEEDETEEKSRKFWLMRRESFNLLRSKVKDKHTAPFIDDLVVPPEHLTEFLPQLREIIKRYKLLATIAGHLGDGNFHIIPLMKIEDPKERQKLKPVMKEVNNLVINYGGSVSGEHNDGMVRGPWLEQMYSPNVLGYMKEIKHLYDPQNIFNPHKKTDATWEFSFANIRKKF